MWSQFYEGLKSSHEIRKRYVFHLIAVVNI